MTKEQNDLQDWLNARAAVAERFDPENTPDARAAFRDQVRREMDAAADKKARDE